MSKEAEVYEAEAQEEETQKPLTIEEIEAQLGEPQSEFSFPVSLLPGVLLRAKLIQDAAEGVKIHKKTEAFGNLFKMRKGKGGQETQNLPPGPLKEWENKGVTPEIAQQAAFVSEMMIEPALTKVKALEWAKRRGMLFAELFIACNTQGRSAVLENEVELLEEEKND